MNTCRLCSKVRDKKNLLRIDSKKLNVFEIVSETFNIKLDRHFSHSGNICKACLNKLNSSKAFCTQIKKNEEELTGRLSLNIDPSLFDSVVIKVEKLDERAIEELKVSIKEETTEIEELTHCWMDFSDNDNNDDDEDVKEPETLLEEISPVRQKVKKSRRPIDRAKSRKLVKTKQQFLDSLYKHELKGKFTDKPDTLDVLDCEKLPNGRLTPESDAKYSYLKWSSNYTWNCTKESCSEQFSNIVDLDTHLRRFHDKKKFTSYCTRCGINCTNYASFVSHTINYHNLNARFSCIVCSEVYWNFMDLFKHHKAQHIEVKAFFCIYCGRHMYTPAQLRSHLITRHNRLDSRPNLECDICGHNTKRKDRLFSHMTSHISMKHICEQCGMVFTRLGGLTVHVRNVHNNADLVVNCPTCGKEFHNMRALRKHEKIVHQKHLTAHNFVCEYEGCGKRFSTAYSLKTHQYSHNPDAVRYTCPHCGKVFRYTSGFKYHVRSMHTNEKPYRCPCCENTFFDYSNALKHIKGSHGGDLRPIRLTK